MSGGWWLATVAAVVVAVLAHRLATRGLFTVTVRAGRIASVRGRVPPGVLADLREVLAGSDAAGTVRALDVGRGTAVVELRGRFDERVAQRIRNVVGNVPVARLRAG